MSRFYISKLSRNRFLYNAFKIIKKQKLSESDRRGINVIFF